ncbi:pimeloyl-ACP methyl ester carboxylesterase [Paenibacillus shirakamiensis]|uniref:Pimeloyl-ACP methyl ester carboxylesterase n=1 Tax=Paenibacillus shirakamiensis TaxID=1265935 RepID=A0ABS4JLB0_9BACL|nr:alpha/beta hydrolase [Paenibacillus shirakamiensis]MBP2002473.1 pimeloyl-ACP methyl ester carboxylesterase [Paenibacillus shirakamiensis]
MEKATVNGSTIAYDDRGEGEVVVLVHGFCGSSSYFDKIVPLLSKQYRVITPDLRGHGSSDAPLGAYTIEQLADDVTGLMESIGVEKYTLLGHSLGGYVTLSVAQRYASSLNGFGLLHSTAYPDSEEAKEKRLKAVSTIQSEGITTFIENLVPALFAPDHVEQLTEDVIRVKEIGYKTPPQGASGAAMAMRERPDRRDVLSSSTLPILLVAGEKDGVIPAEKTFTTEGPKVTQETIAGVGHMSMYEAPEQLANIILEFLGKIHSTQA